jgi:hypothetical protein
VLNEFTLDGIVEYIKVPEFVKIFLVVILSDTGTVAISSEKMPVLVRGCGPCGFSWVCLSSGEPDCYAAFRARFPQSPKAGTMTVCKLKSGDVRRPLLS